MTPAWLRCWALNWAGGDPLIPSLGPFWVSKGGIYTPLSEAPLCLLAAGTPDPARFPCLVSACGQHGLCQSRSQPLPCSRTTLAPSPRPGGAHPLGQAMGGPWVGWCAGAQLRGEGACDSFARSCMQELTHRTLSGGWLVPADLLSQR